jgi:hypothetical protein
MTSLRDVIESVKDAPGLDGWKQHWGPGNGDEIHNWALEQYVRHLRVDTTLYLLDLLWPNFVEIGGCVLRETFPDPWTGDGLRAYLELYQTPPSPETVESLCNHIHLRDVFRYAPSNDLVDMETWQFLAETTAEMWRWSCPVSVDSERLRD